MVKVMNPVPWPVVLSTYFLIFIMSVNVKYWVYCEQSNVALDQEHGGEGGRVYIVYMGALSGATSSSSSSSSSHSTHHHKLLLQQVLDQRRISVEDALLRSYHRSFNGFAANLTDTEARKLSDREDIVSVFPSKMLQLHTTHSWDFMGLPLTAKRNPTIESDIIIGVIDTGIWPESMSFTDDNGFLDLPKKWSGVCQGGFNFTCNRKLIGARYYSGSSARDIHGHGTHTASIVAGNVADASFFGLAGGNARGGVPSARLAVYQVCSGLDGCAEEDVLTAFDDAIADGVDLISISMGFSEVTYGFLQDAISIGGFHAMDKGILTSHSAGNNFDHVLGVGRSSPPWLLSVAAGTTDRRFTDKMLVVLRTGTEIVLEGTAVNSFELSETKSFPLVYGDNVSSHCDVERARSCEEGCLDQVRGKMVVCNRERPEVALAAGAAGAIFMSAASNDELSADASPVYPLPALRLPDNFGAGLTSFIRTSKNLRATILKSEAVEDSQAPRVASFSTRGPIGLLSDIIKPDVIAPGVNILAAFPPIVPLSQADSRFTNYNILSGTSVSCPHAAGAAAYVKTFHPDWSPSAIKSALMTTAWIMNATNNPGGEFAYGAGHIDPVKALNPGLVYEADQDDYLRFLCNIGFNSRHVPHLTNRTYTSTCPIETPGGFAKDLNYPSMAHLVSASSYVKVEFPRTVMNVGLKNSTYTAKVTSSNNKVKIIVRPSVLSFKSLGEKKSFVVSVSGDVLGHNVTESSSLVWSDGVHSVRSPIVVYTLPN